MNDCIFCKIVAGEIPATKVYETDKVLAFLDVAPTYPGHTLIIPKTHAKNIEEVSEDDLTEVIKVVKIIGKAIKDGLGIIGYNTLSNNDPIAGQSVAHLHIHIIPRIENDGLSQWPQGEYKEGQAEEVAKKIKDSI